MSGCEKAAGPSLGLAAFSYLGSSELKRGQLSISKYSLVDELGKGLRIVQTLLRL